MATGTGHIILTAAEWSALGLTAGAVPEFPTNFSSGAAIADGDEVYIANVAWTSLTASDAVADADYTFDDSGTAGYVGVFLIDGTNRIATITLGGVPVSLDYDTFSISTLNSGQILKFRDPSWDGVSADVARGLYGIPSPGSPEYSVRFTASGTQISSGTYTVPTLASYADQEVLFYETVAVVGKTDVETVITIQAEAAWTPSYTEFGTSTYLSTAQPLGANTSSFLMAIQGRMTESAGAQHILWMSSDCRVSTDSSGFIRVLFSDPAGANDMIFIMDTAGANLAVGQDFTFLFAYNNGSARGAIKKDAGSFITKSLSFTDVSRRMDQALRIGADSTPGTYWTGAFARIAFWTDVGSLIDVTTSTVQNQFVESDGTPKGLYSTRGLYGTAASGKLRLDLVQSGENFDNNEGAVTGIAKAAGTLT